MNSVDVARTMYKALMKQAEETGEAIDPVNGSDPQNPDEAGLGFVTLDGDFDLIEVAAAVLNDLQPLTDI